MRVSPAPVARRFEDIKVRDQAGFVVTVSDADVRRFAELIGDYNPLHLNDEFAKQSRFERRIVHGMLIASYFSRLVGMYLPGLHCLYLSQESRFVAPVFPGEQLHVKGTVVQRSEELRVLVIRTEVLRVDGQLVVDGLAKVRVEDGASQS